MMVLSCMEKIKCNKGIVSAMKPEVLLYTVPQKGDNDQIHE